MILVNKPLLAEFRRRRCEVCGNAPPSEPHHVLCRGMGGGGRIDHPFNLLSACLRCHRRYHDGNLMIGGKRATKADMFAIVALRERRPVDELEAAVYAMRNAPKNTPMDEPLGNFDPPVFMRQPLPGWDCCKVEMPF